MGKTLVSVEDINKFLKYFPEFECYREEIDRRVKEFVRGDIFPRGLIEKIMPEKVAKAFKEYLERQSERA